MNTVLWLLVFLVVSIGSFYGWSIFYQSTVNKVLKAFAWFVAFIGMHVSMFAWMMFCSASTDSLIFMISTYAIVSSPIFVFTSYLHSKSRFYVTAS